jgi:hypothetical protein
LGLSFFGLTSNTASIVRANLFTQIHEIVFHGKGGYDWNTIYNMPRWLRLFTFNKINDFYQKENEAHENASKGGSNKSTLIDPSGQVHRENWSSVPQKITPGAKTKPQTKYK